jgi:methylthioribose-1-phosphate isomerase
MRTEKGEDIPIEERPAYEVTEMWFERPVVPEGAKVYNPAFDFADHELVTAIITEYGVARPPYNDSLNEIFRKKQDASK